MSKKTKILSIVLIIILTAIIFLTHLFPSEIITGASKCGGCCFGSLSQCNLVLGTPFEYYYSGNGVFGKKVSGFSIISLIIDFTIWLTSLFLIYKLIYIK